MGAAIEHPVSDLVKSSFVTFDIRVYSDALSPERLGTRMSKITNDDITWSGIGCFIAAPIWQQWA